MSERRDATWQPGEPRQRRRPRWGDFRGAYPRIVTVLAFLLAGLVLFDGWLFVKRHRYARQVAGYRGAMTDAQRRRADSIVAANEGRVKLQLALVRRDAQLEDDLNLAISVEKGKLTLQREGAELREIAVRIGPEKKLGDAPDSVRVATPRGRFTVQRVVDATYRWPAPEWLFGDRKLAQPAAREIQGGLGPVAILLSGGAVIYSDPASGPLHDPDYVLPGAVRASAADLKAIADALDVGTPVYFF
jgi:hypothetical protein